MAGTTLNKAQEHYVRTADGSLPEMHTQMLINALKAEALVLSDRAIAKLRELYGIIRKILDEAA